MRVHDNIIINSLFPHSVYHLYYFSMQMRVTRNQCCTTWFAMSCSKFPSSFVTGTRHSALLRDCNVSTLKQTKKQRKSKSRKIFIVCKKSGIFSTAIHVTPIYDRTYELHRTIVVKTFSATRHRSGEGIPTSGVEHENYIHIRMLQ